MPSIGPRSHELRITDELAQSLRAKRLKQRMGQTQIAKIIKSSQSRVAKMEAADPSVSVDLLVRSHLALGTSSPELGRIIAALSQKVDKTLHG